MSGDRDNMLLRLTGVTKSFPGVAVLRDLGLEVTQGQVHVLLGENGAGKSTLIKCIAGVYSPDAGAIEFAGEPRSWSSPRDALEAGVAVVYQELALVPSLSVAENIALGEWPTRHRAVDGGTMRLRAADLMHQVGLDIDPRTTVRTLPRSVQQLVEIARAIGRGARLVIFDEPTASLTDQEAERLFAVIRRLTSTGCGVLYITHRMAEIQQIGDVVTVLRDGASVLTESVHHVDHDTLVAAMAGRPVDDLYPTIAHHPGEMLAALDHVSGHPLHDVTIEIRAGEVVGVAGLLASGKSDVGRMLVGLAHPESGHVLLGGSAVTRLSPSSALKRGVTYYPPDRKSEGLALMRSVSENVTMGSLIASGLSRAGFIRRSHEHQRVGALTRRLGLRPPDISRPAGSLSGGNQQKLLLARGLIRPVRVHVFDDPTVGVDVGARAEVYRVVKQLCESGNACVVISSDLAEVTHLAHRLYVMREGIVSAHLTGDDVSEERALAHFF